MIGARDCGPAPSQQLEAVAVDVARLAADHVRSRLGAGRTADTKSSPTDVVTDTDLETERLIRSELAVRSPGSSIVGEEYIDQHGDNRIGWIVDPIDGTINFLYNLPVVSVSIAATCDGAVVAGAVTDVVLDETFSASRGGGAGRDGIGIEVGGARDLAASLVGTGFAYDSNRRAEEADVVGRVLPRARDVRCFGSAALHLCWVGCGRLDAFYQRGLELYDYAAGMLIAAEAGAVVERPEDGNNDLLLAAAPGISSALRAVLVETSAG